MPPPGDHDLVTLLRSDECCYKALETGFLTWLSCFFVLHPQLSRDGKFLAYIKPAPQTGVSNVFIRRLPQPTPPAAAAAVAARSSSSPPAAAQPLRTAFESSARSTDAARLAREQRSSIFEREGTDFDQQITFDLTQGVSAYSWTEDSSSILYIQVSNCCNYSSRGEGAVRLGRGCCFCV